MTVQNEDGEDILNSLTLNNDLQEAVEEDEQENNSNVNTETEGIYIHVYTCTTLIKYF